MIMNQSFAFHKAEGLSKIAFHMKPDLLKLYYGEMTGNFFIINNLMTKGMELAIIFLVKQL